MFSRILQTWEKKNNEKTTYENKKRKKTGKKLEETVIWQTTHDKLHS